MPTVAQRPCAKLLLTTFVALLAAALLATGCGGGNSGPGGSPNPVRAFFRASGSATTPNFVRLKGRVVTDKRVIVDVVMGGASTNQDLYSFAFDIIISNTTVAEFVPGSGSFGTVLTLTGSQGSSVQAAQVGRRVIIGVTKTGGGSGNGIGAGEPAIVSLSFRILAKGTATLSFAGSPANPQNPTNDPAALDSAVQVVSSVRFDAALASIGG